MKSPEQASTHLDVSRFLTSWSLKSAAIPPRGEGFARNQRNNPMQSKLPMHLSPRCGARTKSSGEPCRSPAMKNGRCRMHGGKSPGAPRGNRNAMRHGRYTAEAIARREQICQSLRLMKARAAAARAEPCWARLQRHTARHCAAAKPSAEVA